MTKTETFIDMVNKREGADPQTQFSIDETWQPDDGSVRYALLWHGETPAFVTGVFMHLKEADGVLKLHYEDVSSEARWAVLYEAATPEELLKLYEDNILSVY